MRDHKKYYQEHKASINETNKRSYEKNKDKIAKRRLEYKLENQEKLKLRSREYYLKNKEKIDEQNRKWHRENKDKYYETAKRWRENNKERYRAKMRAASKIWSANNKDKIITNRQRTRNKLREDVLAAYGNKCKCCGESTKEFLCIDHINNDGAKHKRENNIKSAQAMYTWLRKNNYPKDGFQILCHNCNCAKGFYGECPHQKLKIAI